MGFNRGPSYGMDAEYDYGHSAVDPSASTGTGGGVMSIWGKDRLTKLKNLATGSFVNNSAYSVPAGFADSATYSMDVPFDQNEEVHGVSATGFASDGDGLPLSGTVTIEAAGVVFAEESAAGQFIINAEPPVGIVLGTDVENDEYDFRFSPANDGLDFYEQGIGLQPSEFEIAYGNIQGTVTNYAGEPVSNVAVSGAGTATQTDENGFYRLVAPGGTDVGLAALSRVKQVQPAAGSSLTVDWQYARLRISVVTPDLDPVVGANVQVGQDTYQTNGDGQVVVDPAEITKYEILISDTVYREADIQQEGDLYELRAGNEQDKAGVKIRLVDSKTGDPVRDLPAVFTEQGVRARSDSDGVLSLFTDDPEMLSLTLAPDDRRYVTTEYELDLTDGNTVEGRVEIDPKKQVTNR